MRKLFQTILLVNVFEAGFFKRLAHHAHVEARGVPAPWGAAQLSPDVPGARPPPGEATAVR